MFRPAAAVLVALLGMVACGGSSNPAQGPIAAGVSVQPADVPHGMVRCDLSGDIGSFIDKEKSPDPSTARSTSDEWGQAQKDGATSAYVSIYTDSASHCGSIKSSTSDIAAAPYKVVANFVIQYKNEKSASDAYTSGAVFGVSASSLRSGGAQAIEGTKTGLGPNSIFVSQAISNQTFYIALWQNKAFDMFLAVLNVDPSASQKIATSANSRIK